jgi:hypothetical protein
MTQLKRLLIDALSELQKIPKMRDVLQPSINALKKPTTHVPEGDYKKVAHFKDLIVKIHGSKLFTKDQSPHRHAKALIELAQLPKQKQAKKRR